MAHTLGADCRRPGAPGCAPHSTPPPGSLSPPSDLPAASPPMHPGEDEPRGRHFTEEASRIQPGGVRGQRSGLRAEDPSPPSPPPPPSLSPCPPSSERLGLRGRLEAVEQEASVGDRGGGGPGSCTGSRRGGAGRGAELSTAGQAEAAPETGAVTVLWSSLYTSSVNSRV